MNIKEQLLQGKPFSGRNGAFTGRVERGNYYFL